MPVVPANNDQTLFTNKPITINTMSSKSDLKKAVSATDLNTEGLAERTTKDGGE